VCSSDLEAVNPGTQKSIGDRIKENTAWHNARITVMERICTAKFAQNGTLREFLMSTGVSHLAEDNPNDGYWGIKMSRNNPRSSNVQNHKANNLGKILMRIRDDLA
jgi:ribA/ribD-fused uncharacterized protein